MKKGLPQGSVLSPALYEVNTYEIDKGLELDITELEFADDIGIYVTVSKG